MKWTIIALVFLGIVAAASAAILAVTLQQNTLGSRTPVDSPNEEIDVLVSVRELPAMTRVDSMDVKTDKMGRAEAQSRRALTNAAQAVGQILIVPVKAGEAYTAGQFASAGSELRLATALPKGGRAMSILLSDDTGIEDLLYPGSLVDVVASFRFPSLNGSSAEVVSVTLLQSIQVLAVGRRTIMAEAPQGAPDPTNRRGRMLTLMVNNDQAEVLQLASTQGKVAVALRNPLDKEMPSLSGTRMSDLSKNLADEIARLAGAEFSATAMKPDETTRPAGTQPEAGGAAPGTPGSAPAAHPAPRETPLWITTIIRGRTKEIQKFPMPEESQ